MANPPRTAVVCICRDGRQRMRRSHKNSDRDNRRHLHRHCHGHQRLYIGEDVRRCHGTVKTHPHRNSETELPCRPRSIEILRRSASAGFSVVSLFTTKNRNAPGRFVARRRLVSSSNYRITCSGTLKSLRSPGSLSRPCLSRRGTRVSSKSNIVCSDATHRLPHSSMTPPRPPKYRSN